MSDLRLDERSLKFLDSPKKYISDSDLKLEPLTRQFKTAQEILRRFQQGRGVLLADDVGLGKTTIGALVAWVVACQKDQSGNLCNRVRIYAPNEVLRRRWAEELERHLPMLSQLGAIGNKIKQGDVGKLHAGNIQVTTHYALVKSHNNSEQRTTCDLMIIDEAHRAKGDGSAFNEALRNLGDRAKRKLILTATPFSIRLAELEQLLQFVGATKLDAVCRYANELERLYSLGDGHDISAESERLVITAKEAISQLQPYLIRHGINDLSDEEQHFGEVAKEPWNIRTISATPEDIALLLRMDRILHLTQEQKGERRNDPRFHIGWQHLGVELECAVERATDSITHRHIKVASKALHTRRDAPHPKMAAVMEAIQSVIDNGEKVLVFCHHRATASELLVELEKGLKTTNVSRRNPSQMVWREAWESLLPSEDPLVKPIINWLCTSGIRAQIAGWLDKPAITSKELAKQLSEVQPRNKSKKVPSIAKAAESFVASLLDEQSTSTRSVLRSIVRKSKIVGGKPVKISNFPGDLDNGFKTMGFWDMDKKINTLSPSTLYTGKPDILLTLFNSPFGPDVLVTTDRLSEGVDLHRYCRHLIHYELDPSPVRTIQRNGRIRRVGSWASLINEPIQFAYPIFGGTRDERAVEVMKQRINAFGLLLGGVPHFDFGCDDESKDRLAENVFSNARRDLDKLNQKLCV